MNKLEKLYTSIKNLEELGLELTPEMLLECDKLEEQIIKDEILPALGQDIEPRLRQIQRPLVLVVEHNPGQPLSVKLSRKINVSELLEAKAIEIDPKVSHNNRANKTNNRVNKTTRLRVTFDDGKVVYKEKASETFAEVIRLIGATKVRELGLKMMKVPLVSNRKDDVYGKEQIGIGEGWFVITHSPTERKKQLLDKISKKLHLGLKVEII